MITDNADISHQPDLPAPVGAGRYNMYTGALYTRASATGTGPTAARLGLEPPRFCADCGRRMIVQIRPDGWWAKCSRHGLVDSTDLEMKR
ncbi:MAG: hypothetical protein K0U70_11105 [Actinomycetia bacterium]|nr:hypothetical protein [Actinomycetes bacterium]MCH9768334.1 hypothetical protein [Actinomycetes bacterium]